MNRYLLICLLVATNSSLWAEERPNIIVIFADDLGWGDVGAQGVQPDIRTPHLDALAEAGLRATNGYVTAPQCVPSRAGLLTGRAQSRFGVESNASPLAGFDAQRTLAERLQQAGYATGMSGKWHLGPREQIVSHGFDDVYYPTGTSGKAWANYDLKGNSIAAAEIDSPLYHIEANSSAACAFIQRHQAEPFFFYLAYRAPHVPLDAPAKYLKRFPGDMPERRRQCLAMMSAVDDGVGQVMKTLRQLQLEERTLIFFMGDNGAPLKISKLDAPGGGPGWDGSLNEPLNGEKGMLSEGGIREPWIASWKGHIPAGQVYEHPVISLDVAATAQAVAGLPADPVLDGVNLMPYFRGENLDAPHAALYWRWIAQAAIREGRWKLLIGGKRRYLFDLENDREEKHNLLLQHPQLAERLESKLANWSNELQPPGIAPEPMSSTWEEYFDFYLEGKPAPQADQSRKLGPATAGKPQTLSGWTARSGTLAATEDGFCLQTQAGKTGFITQAGLSLSVPATIQLTLRSATAGTGFISWRCEGEKDFKVDRRQDFEIPATQEWQTQNVRLPSSGKIIHLRIHFNNPKTCIQAIDLQS